MGMLRIAVLGALIAASLAGFTHAAPSVPRYRHIFVIVEENKDYKQILDPAVAPHIATLAATYGNATQFFGEVHPSEANYVAMLGGDTFGIHDDDGVICHAGMTDPACAGAAAPGYADHTVRAPNLGGQMEAVGLTWKGYYETLPEPGSMAFKAGDPSYGPGMDKAALYAQKHVGFLNFAAVQNDPRRAEKIVGFGQLRADLAANTLPNFALIVPNQCNEMHGLHGEGVPADCDGANLAQLIGRGDKVVCELVTKLQATKAWKSRENVAIVITFDEGAGKTREGCCAVTPDAPSNFGGGHIPTIVITNHGPRAIADDTAYNHYSLLRTFEDAFGIQTHLAHAADTDKGVVSMVKLFATTPSARP